MCEKYRLGLETRIGIDPQEEVSFFKNMYTKC